MISRKTSLKHRVGAIPGAALPLARNVSADVSRRLVKMARATPGRGFTPFDFLDLGSPHSVGMALTRLTRSGELRRLARGLYDVPRTHPVLGELLPTADDIAQALARRDGASVQPAGAMAANLLSLSEQVPARGGFYTHRPRRTRQKGALTRRPKKRAPPPRRHAPPPATRACRWRPPGCIRTCASLPAIGNDQLCHAACFRAPPVGGAGGRPAGRGAGDRGERFLGVLVAGPYFCD